MNGVTANDIIESLYKIMCSSTSTVADSRVANNDYYRRRVLGFRAEVAFEELLDCYPDIDFLEGGQFISKKLSGERDNKNQFAYTTISSDEPAQYEEIYKIISNWNEVEDLFYIKITDDDWETESFQTRTERGGARKDDEILKPAYTFYKYDFGTESFVENEVQNFDCVLERFNTPTRTPSLYHLRSRHQFDYFNKYSLEVLKKIYANRYFLDVVLRQAQGRQIIDLDGFLRIANRLIVVEVKEKSPIKDSDDQNTWKYGWDSRRILWYLYLLKKIKLDVLYNIRQINNREEREFVQWDSVFIDDFLRGTSWSSSRGGGGGEDTLLGPYSFFSRLEDILQELSE